MSQAKTRFAPSPTGYWHVGGYRTTIFNKLLADKTGGKFCLRIEDTDQNRYIEGAAEGLMKTMQQVGMHWDEFLGFQSEIKETGRYNEAVDYLLKQGYAYKCYCTPEEIEQRKRMNRNRRPGYDGFCHQNGEAVFFGEAPNVNEGKPFVVRLHMPDIEIECNDLLRGPSIWYGSDMTDPVLIKSDGWPTYHLASVCDDHAAGITHVLRGDEWMATWPIHVYLYAVLEWNEPIWVHLPPVMGTNGKKLSKRDPNTIVKVEDFLAMGILPDALTNYLATVGCSWDLDSEVMTWKDMVDNFSLDRVQEAGGQFNMKKLIWFNRQWIQRMTAEQVFQQTIDQLIPLQGEGDLLVSYENMVKLITLCQSRMETLNDLPNMLRSYFHKEVKDLDISLAFSDAVSLQQVDSILDQLIICWTQDQVGWEAKDMEEWARNMALHRQLHFRDFAQVLRVALFGSKVSLPLFESIEILGSEVVLARLSAAKEAVAVLT